MTGNPAPTNDPQRLMLQGRLVEAQAEFKKLEDRAENILAALQIKTFVESSPLDLDGGNIVTGATDLAATIKQGAIVRSKIEELKSKLGVR